MWHWGSLFLIILIETLFSTTWRMRRSTSAPSGSRSSSRRKSRSWVLQRRSSPRASGTDEPCSSNLLLASQTCFLYGFFLDLLPYIPMWYEFYYPSTINIPCVENKMARVFLIKMHPIVFRIREKNLSPGSRYVFDIRVWIQGLQSSKKCTYFPASFRT